MDLTTTQVWERSAEFYLRQLGWLIEDGDSERAYQLARHIVGSCPFIRRIDGQGRALEVHQP